MGSPNLISIHGFFLCHYFLFLHYSQAVLHPPFDNNTDQEALLSFKSSLIDPHGALDSWHPNSSFCKWLGVLCNLKRRQVISLRLEHRSLAGPISPHLTNLSFLRRLELQGNNFSGRIPPEIHRLFRLRVLNLSSNSLHGTIPPSLSHCSMLRVVDVLGNELHGRIPSELGSLSALYDLNLGRNNFSGTIPSSLGNLSSLNKLNVVTNNLEGPIPHELGRLNRLWYLHLGDNKISGSFPAQLMNISSLNMCSLPKNQFSGELPSNLFIALSNLSIAFFGGNMFDGQIPESLSNASKLERFDLSVNQISGEIPSFWMLERIQELNLEMNYLTSNGKKGQLPRSIGNVMSHIGWGGEQTTIYKGVETFQLAIAVGIRALGYRSCRLAYKVSLACSTVQLSMPCRCQNHAAPGHRRGRRERGRPPIRRRGRKEAERNSSQEGSTTAPYAFVPPPEHAPPPQIVPPPENSINPDEGITTWETFKEAFLKYYYPKETRIKKQQEFNHLTQEDRTVDQYDQVFMRLRRFAPSLADMEEKQTEKFVLGLNPKTCYMLEAFNPTTYEEALRTAKDLEEPPPIPNTEEAPVPQLWKTTCWEMFGKLRAYATTSKEVGTSGTVVTVGTPAGVDLVTKNRVKDGQVVIAGQTIHVDLKVVDMTDFDIILGMDWLAENFASIDCHKKDVIFTPPNGLTFKFKGTFT
ncbi:LRR receptor-like serine/threonine-protein kinase EFR, partial [Cucurbita argyrosperma subsp. argyrosperma]